MKMKFTAIFALVTAEVLIGDETELTGRILHEGATMYNEWSLSLEAIAYQMILKLGVKCDIICHVDKR